MKRRCQTIGILLLVAAGVLCGQPARQPRANSKARAARGNPVERLMALPPEKRERVLEKLPARKQANLRQRLERFDKLPAAERARLNEMWSTFNDLPPEKQEIVTRQIQAFNSLPEARREVLRPVLRRLSQMPEEKRTALLNGRAFQKRFSAAELQMLGDIAGNYPLPSR